MAMKGREKLVICASCGRRVPRSKAVTYVRGVMFSTDLKTADDIKVFEKRKEYYCPSCGKHRKIYEKKKRLMSKYNR
jgi:predicted RNA-binding Zn-ribbon protein involved in translation (DUF1610 family)